MSIESIASALFWLCVYIAPLGIIAGSKLTWGNEKTGWLLATIIFSWMALIAYYATVLSLKDRKALHQAKMKRRQLTQQALAKQQAKERRRQAGIENRQARAADNGLAEPSSEPSLEADQEPSAPLTPPPADDSSDKGS